MSLKLVLQKPEVNNLKVEIVPSTLVIDDKLQKEIDKNWELFLEEMKRKGIKAWNGKKFRFERLAGNVIGLSKTDFKTVIILRNLGYLKIRNNVAISSITITKDNFLVFGRRKNVDFDSNKVACIAGGLEPIKGSEDLIFENMRVELKEELGLNEDEYSLTLQGFYKSLSLGSYRFDFMTNTRLSKSEITERFKYADENEENSELVFYENTKEGIKELVNDKDMQSEVTEYFTKYYELKH